MQPGVAFSSKQATRISDTYPKDIDATFAIAAVMTLQQCLYYGAA
jgi:hypothetical protein